MPRSNKAVVNSLRNLLSEVRELRKINDAFASLQREHAELLSVVGALTGRGRRGPGRPKGSKNRPRPAGGKRHRSSPGQVSKMYRALAAKLPKEWTTKEEICKAAGLKPAACAAAWKRLAEGYTDEKGNSVKGIMVSNGSRGLAGRYRKA